MPGPLLLIYPPLVNLGMSPPSLALPILAGYVVARGFTAEQRDLNRAFIEFLIERGALQELAQREEDAIAQGLSDREERIAHAMESRFFADNSARRSLIFGQGKRVTALLQRFDPRLRLAFREDCLSDLPSLLQGEGPYDLFFRERLLPQIRELRYTVVGLSLTMRQQILPALWLARLIHQADPGVHLVLGGSCINLLDEAQIEPLAALPWVHSLVRFGGGKTLLTILNAVAANAPLPPVPNLIDASGPSARFPTNYEVYEVGEGLDAVFDPDEIAYFPTNELPVLVSTGCYWGRCTYCSNVNIAKHENRIIGVEALVDQIARLVERHGCRNFRLITEAIPPQYCADLARSILARGLDIGFNMFMRIDGGFDQTCIRLLAQAGLRRVTIGAESTIPRILKLMRKGSSPNLMIRQIQWLREASITANLNFIFDFPGTTMAEARRMIEDIKTLNGMHSEINIQSFILLRNTPMAEHPEFYGIQIDESAPRDQDDILGSIPFHDTKGMNHEEKQEIWAVYNAFMHDIIRTLLRNMLMDVNPTTWRLRCNWPRLVSFMRAFTAWREDGTGAWFYNVLDHRLIHLEPQEAALMALIREGHHTSLSDFLNQYASSITQGPTDHAFNVHSLILRLIESTVLPGLFPEDGARPTAPILVPAHPGYLSFPAQP